MVDDLNLKFQKINGDNEQAKSKYSTLSSHQVIHITQLSSIQSDIVKNEKRIYDLKETLELKTYNSKEKITRALKD